MLRRTRISIGTLVILLIISTAGYMVLEGWSLIDALYMTIITFTTVGFQEVRPLSEVGRVFTVFVTIGGVGAMLYFLTALMQQIVENEIFHAFVRRRRMRSTLANMRQHYLLCGFGRVGREVAQAFAAEGVDFIVIDYSPEAAAAAHELGYACVQGSATEDDVLYEAGVERAQGLVAVTGDDSHNVFITLTARGLSQSLQVVARTSDIANAEKLRRAGANKVISPLAIGGRRIAMSAVRPLAVDFVDSILGSQAGGDHLRFDEIWIGEGSPLAGLAVGDAARSDSVETIGLRRIRIRCCKRGTACS